MNLRSFNRAKSRNARVPRSSIRSFGRALYRALVGLYIEFR